MNFLSVIITLVFLIQCSGEIKTEITIDAPREKVWQIFAATDRYPEWNPMIKNFKGNMKQGEEISVKLQQPEMDPMEFTPVVTGYEKFKLFEWHGTLLASFVFSGKHRFEFSDTKDGKTLLKHGEQFSGLLTPALNMENTRKGFELMNEALKKRAEGK